MSSKKSVLVVVVLCACAGLSRAGVTGLGILGDSLSDDYDLSYAKAWVDQLASYSSVNVGAWGSWPYPRNTDYEYNWAKQGASSADLLSQGQHTGLAGQIAAGEVSHAVLFVGHNDFKYWESPYQNIYNGAWVLGDANTTGYINGVISNIETALDTLLVQTDSVVLSTFADYAVCPAAQSYCPDPVKRDRVSAVMDEINDGIRALAEDRGIVLVDTHLLADELFGSNLAPNTTLTVGGYEIFLNTFGPDVWNAYVEDGIHPQSVIQGILANLFMKGLNAYDAELTPFTEAELLAHSGLTGTGTNTLPFDVQDYVYDYTPEPATLCLLLPSLVMLHSRRNTRKLNL